MVPSVKFPPTTLTVNDVVHTMALVCTHRLNEILGFGNWEKKIEGEGGGGGDDCGGGAKGGATVLQHLVL